MNRHMIIGWTTFIALVDASILVAAYLYFVNVSPPAVIKNSPMPTRMQEYRHGDVIQVFADYCKNVSAPATLDIQFVDGIVFDVGEPTRMNSPMGCDQKWFDVVRVSDKLPPGEYYLRGQSTYQVNILRSRTIDWRTQWFRVVDDDVR